MNYSPPLSNPLRAQVAQSQRQNKQKLIKATQTSDNSHRYGAKVKNSTDFSNGLVDLSLRISSRWNGSLHLYLGSLWES